MNVQTMFKTPRIRSRSHMEFVASHRCCVCQRASVQVHHLTHGYEPKARGLKASDSQTVPMCRQHHDALHARGDEAAFWHGQRIDAEQLAADLWAQSVAAGRTKENPQGANLRAVETQTQGHTRNMTDGKAVFKGFNA